MKKILSIVIFVFTAYLAGAQIPNSGFENWSQPAGTSYWNPDEWGCLNFITAPMNVYTCERGTPGSPGSYYLKVTSKAIIGGAVMPGIVVSGQLDESTFLPTNGFPFTQRPQKLTGKWQHMIFGTSQGYIDVELTKWNTATNSRDVIAYAHQQLSGMAMSWANFNITLGYQSTETPDSCMIVFSASGPNPTNLDYLWIDNLAFSGSVGIDAMEPVTATMKIFPNPAKTEFSAEYTSLEAGKGQISITDFSGKQVYTEDRTFISGKNTINISLSSMHLAVGDYVVGIVNNGKLLQQKLVVR